eukprot:CAMPEP_0119317968 /NCGR_PEP_ID=MMETSP1333-20130426/45094_1 /TAXON_ID=418940 /ORGANISM="Scyphosphaera apsteinii, Strain RCC1455" /LENGTH=219 /DNA_ID=CAMNT_0007324053 /DNA_START=161 /DNA_END=820 /DNA_ORIENTATION=+
MPPAAAQPDLTETGAASSMPEAPTAPASESPAAMWCNEQGCWVGEPPPVSRPDGRSLSQDTVSSSHEELGVKGKVVHTKRRPAVRGIFAPLVLGTKRLMGEKELNKLRAEVIAKHTKVINAFVDTSESRFGQLVLKRMFAAADKDGNGTLDREEIRSALNDLGFTFIEDKQLDKIMGRADADGNEVIDFEEFVKETPRTLRVSLVKLAKANGHDLGFLA